MKTYEISRFLKPARLIPALKACRRCHIEKASGGFSPEPRNRDGLGSYCHVCNAKTAAARRLLDPDRHRTIWQRSRDKHRKPDGRVLTLRKLVSKFAITDGCWNWEASRTGGYGSQWWKGKVRRAHRVIYELMKGPIPDGLHLDHLCRNTACVRPSHLEAVTPGENMLRGVAPTAGAFRQNQCLKGHALTDDNVYRNKRGGRQCKACVLVRMQRT